MYVVLCGSMNKHQEDMYVLKILDCLLKRWVVILGSIVIEYEHNNFHFNNDLDIYMSSKNKEGSGYNLYVDFANHILIVWFIS